jgi:tetratricopeptide (TPR) repeat protein
MRPEKTTEIGGRRGAMAGWGGAEAGRRSLDLRTGLNKHARRRMPQKTSVRKKLSRDEERELDIKIGFMEGVIRRDPRFIEALQILGDDYTKRGRFVAGLKVDEQLSQLRPEDPLVQYNLACSYSLTGDFHQAVTALERAIDLGYRDFKWLARDPDLGDLREHPLYKQLRAKLRRKRGRKA